MSFCCKMCGEAQETGTKPRMLLLEDRTKHYVNTYRSERKTYDVETVGWEIVKEIAVCEPCFKEGSLPPADEEFDAFDDN